MSSDVELVPVVYARQQAEAEMLEGILAGHDIICVIKRSAGADVPDFLAAGGRRIYVAKADLERAKFALGLDS